jgi:hypothetical protein
VFGVILPVFRILFRQSFVLDDEKIFGILILGRFGEIEAPGDYGFAIYNHDLIGGSSEAEFFCLKICLNPLYELLQAYLKSLSPFSITLRRPKFPELRMQFGISEKT